MTVSTISVEKVFYVPVPVLANVFLDSTHLSKMSMSPCKCDAKEGGSWEMFGGGVHGKFEKIEKSDHKTVIVQSFAMPQWGGSTSTVTLEFTSVGEQRCKLRITHKGIPDQDAHGNGNQVASIERGWREKYLAGIERNLGFPCESSGH